MYRVIIADSEKEHLDAIRYIISNRELKDLEVVYAGTSDEAIAEMEKKKTDIFICALNSRGMDGKELIDYAGFAFPDMIIIAMVLFTEAGDILKILNQIEIFRLILKPVEVLEDILKPVEEAVKFLKKREKENKALQEIRESQARYKEVYDTSQKELEAAQMKFMLGFDPLQGLTKFSLGGKKEIENFYRKIEEHYLNYMMFEIGNSKIMETSLLNEFNNPDNGNTFSFRIRNAEEIPEKILRHSAFLSAVLASLAEQVVTGCHASVAVSKSEAGTWDIRFLCDVKKDTDKTIQYKNIDKETVKQLFAITKRILKRYAGRSAIGTKESPLAAVAVIE